MKKKTLIIIALLSLGLSAIPNVATVYANQHYFYKSANLNCIICHSDVSAQLEMDSYVNSKHKEVALNHNYTTYLIIGGISYDTGSRNITVYGNHNWYWNGSVWINSSNPSQYRNESLDRDRNGIMDDEEICMLCHSNSVMGANTHASTIAVSTCDDDRCHGNKNFTYNDPSILNINASVSAAGFNISSQNIHSNYYISTDNQSTKYPAISLFGYVHGNVKGSSISSGYYSCLGCHSDISVDVNLVLPLEYNHSDVNAPKGRYQ